METVKETYTDLVVKSKNRDLDAFGQLYQKTYSKLYTHIRSLVRNEHEAEDIIQEVYLKIYDQLPSLKDEEKFLPWAKMIARNYVIDLSRKNNPLLFSEMYSEDAGSEEDFIDSLSKESNTTYEPEFQMEKKEVSETLDTILDGLSPEQRMVIVMFYYQELSLKEIALELNIPENTAYSYASRGRKNIQKQVNLLEKRGYKLRSVMPIPLLLFLFKKMDTYAMEIKPTAAQVTGIVSAISGQTVAGAAGASAANAIGATASSGKAATSIALLPKVIAAASAVTVVVGGGAVLGRIVSNSHQEEPPAVETQVTATESTKVEAPTISAPDPHLSELTKRSDELLNKLIQLYEAEDYLAMSEQLERADYEYIVNRLAPDAPMGTSVVDGDHMYAVYMDTYPSSNGTKMGLVFYDGKHKNGVPDGEAISVINNGITLIQHEIWHNGTRSEITGTDWIAKRAAYFDFYRDDKLESTTVYDYNENGLLISGNATNYEHPNQNETWTYEYDDMNRISRFYMTYDNDKKHTKYMQIAQYYDDAGWMIKQIQCQIEGGASTTYDFEYNNLGKTAREISRGAYDYNNYTKDFEYNEYNQLIQSIQQYEDGSVRIVKNIFDDYGILLQTKQINTDGTIEIIKPENEGDGSAAKNDPANQKSIREYADDGSWMINRKPDTNTYTQTFYEIVSGSITPESTADKEAELESAAPETSGTEETIYINGVEYTMDQIEWINGDSFPKLSAD